MTYSFRGCVCIPSWSRPRRRLLTKTSSIHLSWRPLIFLISVFSCLVNPTLDVDNWSWSEEHKKGWTTPGCIFPKDGVQQPTVMAFQILTFPHSIVRLSKIVLLQRSFLSDSYPTIFDRIWSCALKTIPNGVSQESFSRANPASVRVYRLCCCAKYQSFFQASHCLCTTFLFAFYSRIRSYCSLLTASSSSYSSGILSIQRA